MRSLNITASVFFLLAMMTTAAVAQEAALDPEFLIAETVCDIGNGFDCTEWTATWVQNVTGISAGTQWTIEEDSPSNGCVLTAQPAAGMGPATVNFSITCSDTMNGTAETLGTHLFFVEGVEISFCEGELIGGTILPLGDLDIDCSPDENELEVALIKKSDGIGGFVYGISLHAGKIGATTCKLTTPGGTFDCTDLGEFSLGWTDLSFNEIQTETAGDWTLTLDEGLVTETVATLDLGYGTTPLMADDWPPVPTIVDPVNGATGVPASTSVTWMSDSFVNDVVEVCLDGPNFVELCSDELATSVRSWTPPIPLEAGSWLASVFNFDDIRDVPVGITVTNDPWEIDNFDWVSLDSVASSSFVVPEPKALLLHAAGLLALVFLRRGRARATP